MLIYISHPYGGREDNKEEIEQIMHQLVKSNPQHTYVSPVHTFGYMYNTVSYQQGLEMCLDLLEVCDMMFVFGDYECSQGCNAEIQYCEIHDKPYLTMGGI